MKLFIVWELRIIIVATLELEYLSILALYYTSAAQQFVVAVVAIRRKFSIGDRSGLQTGQSRTHIWCLQRHAVVACISKIQIYREVTYMLAFTQRTRHTIFPKTN